MDTLLHFAQNINRGSFRQTNYGLLENYRRYKQGHPPDYRIDKIAAPLALYYGNHDTLAVPQVMLLTGFLMLSLFLQKIIFIDLFRQIP